jgi:hypothetical protein
MGSVYVLANTRITVSRDTLRRIADLLNITRKAHRDRIFADGILIVKAPSPPTGDGPRPALARSSGSSTEGGASATRGRTSRRRT